MQSGLDVKHEMVICPSGMAEFEAYISDGRARENGNGRPFIEV